MEQGHANGRRNRVAIVMPYFGHAPAYLGAYLASLKGKHLDVLWISDITVPQHPDNFRTFHMTFDMCKERIANRLGTPVCINGAYRLCDFKPMYGHVFEDLLSDYDYWGFGDCDLIYGELFNDFLDQTVLTGEHDAISLAKDYLAGPMSFFRNDERMRLLYRKARNWKEVCAETGKKILHFDECGSTGFFIPLSQGKMTMEECSQIRDSFAAVVWREPNLKFWHQTVLHERTLWGSDGVIVKGSQVSRDGEPLAVYHFITAKGTLWFRVPNVPYERVGDFRITATGFYFGDWMWRTRHIRYVFRYSYGIVKYFRKHGIRRLVKRALELWFPKNKSFV